MIITQNPPLFLITTLLLFHLLTAAAASRPPPFFHHHQPTPTEKQESEFIKKACNFTQSPKACYDLLSPFVLAIQRNPTRLARIAIVVTHARVKHEAIHFSILYEEVKRRGGDRPYWAALQVCAEVLGYAVDSLEDSLNQMRSLVGHRGKAFELQIGNVMTWLSAADTDASTCEDAFNDINVDGPIKRDALRRLGELDPLFDDVLTIVDVYFVQGLTNSP